MITFLQRLWARWRPLLGFSSSQDYWLQRYRLGGDSGAGSGGQSAQYKASVLNAFVEMSAIHTVIEFGCGDGRQLLLAQYPDYTGLDISPDAIDRCRAVFAGDSSKRFLLVEDYDGALADLTLSLDVLFHLVEDSVYDAYLTRLFAASKGYVAIYSSDEPAGRTLRHVRHRHVSEDVATRFPDFERVQVPHAAAEVTTEDNGDRMKFMFYRRTEAQHLMP